MGYARLDALFHFPVAYWRRFCVQRMKLGLSLLGINRVLSIASLGSLIHFILEGASYDLNVKSSSGSQIGATTVKPPEMLVTKSVTKHLRMRAREDFVGRSNEIHLAFRILLAVSMACFIFSPSSRHSKGA